MSKRLSSTSSQTYEGIKLGTESIQLATGKVIRRRIRYDRFRKMYFTIYDNSLLRVYMKTKYSINGDDSKRLWKELPQRSISGVEFFISKLASK